MIAIGFLDTLADPEEGRRVLASCGVKVTRLRSTLTALLVWFVLVSLVRALALTVFEVVTDFNAERGNVENGKSEFVCICPLSIPPPSRPSSV